MITDTKNPQSRPSDSPASRIMSGTGSLQKELLDACHDIITKNMNRQDERIYLLYDTESPLAKIVSSAYISVLDKISQRQDFSLHSKGQEQENIIIREFKNPPQPLYRGGFVNQENPHAEKQKRIITSHNIDENKRVGLNHHEVLEVKTTTDASLLGNKKSEHGFLPSQEGQVQSGQDFSLHSKGQKQQHQEHQEQMLHSSAGQKQQNQDCFADSQGQRQQEQVTDPEIESIKNELISLPKGSIVILVQSTNFRLSTFRIRLELFHRGIHVVEHNHLSYIPEEQFDTFIDCLMYRTPEYVRLENRFSELAENAENTRVQSVNGEFLTFGPIEKIRGNTGDYTGIENKGGTFPIGEVFTEAVDLTSVSGRCLVDTYPREDFSIEICDPFELIIENGRVLPSPHFPPGFQKLYDWVIQYEGEMLVRELGFGLNPAISTTTPLRDINFHERKVGVHLSLGKKHGIFGKKLPKTDLQRFHIDVFIALQSVYIGETQVFRDGRWCI